MSRFFFIKKIKIITIILFLINFNVYSLENKILFKVENQIITTFDVYDHVKYLTVLNPDIQKLDYNQILEISKNNLIREKVKKKEIMKIFKKIEIQDEEFNKVIKSIFKKNNLNNIEELKEFLNSLKLNFVDVKEKILVEIFWNQLIYDKFFSKIKINEEQLKKEIMNKQKNIKKSYLLSEIIFNIENKLDFEEKYKTIKNSIEKIGFKNTALTYSLSSTSTSGGDLGWIDEGAFIDEINKAINEIKIGEYTKPILTQSGFLILMLNDIKENEIEIDFNKELSKLINLKANQQLEQYSNIYYNKIQKDTLIEKL